MQVTLSCITYLNRFSILCFYRRVLMVFFRWCNGNDMNLNMRKCFPIVFSRQKLPVDFSYSIIELMSCIEICAVAVVFDKKLTFSSHFNQIIPRALKLLGFKQRSTVDFSVKSFRSVYSSLVRLFLEYSSVDWFSV